MGDIKTDAATLLGIDAASPLPLVLDVPVAGKLAGLNRLRAYAAAKDGSMPTIMIAGRLKVPRNRWLAKLNGEEVV